MACNHNGAKATVGVYTAKYAFQRGIFSVELMMVVLMLSTLMFFTAECINRQTMQGLLERTAVSGANLLKERTQLYGGRIMLRHEDLVHLQLALSASMARTYSGFESYRLSIHIEQARLETAPDKVVHNGMGWKDCQPDKSLSGHRALFPATPLLADVQLYQVTICYQWDSPYENKMFDKQTVLKAHAIMPGR